MPDWNMVITVHEGQFKWAVRFLQRFGQVRRTDYYNVLVMQAANVPDLMDAMKAAAPAEEYVIPLFSRAVPVTHTFRFRDRPDFLDQAEKIVRPWSGQLADQAFFVRMHRRGFKGRLHSQQIEQHLSGIILEAIQQQGRPGRISFSDPDAVVAIETVGPQAGLALWRREELERWPLLRFNG